MDELCGSVDTAVSQQITTLVFLCWLMTFSSEKFILKPDFRFSIGNWCLERMSLCSGSIRVDNNYISLPGLLKTQSQCFTEAPKCPENMA